jgi:hypothetical protein
MLGEVIPQLIRGKYFREILARDVRGFYFRRGGGVRMENGEEVKNGEIYTHYTRPCRFFTRGGSRSVLL